MISGLDVSCQRDAFRFVLGVIFNQQVSAEQAWRAPALLMERTGARDASSLADVSLVAVQDAICASPALHPFALSMALNVSGAAQVVVDEFAGDARRIWTPVADASTVTRRFEQFRGVGAHKAEVALFLLTVEQGVVVADDGRRRNTGTRCARLGATFGCEAPILV